MVALEVRVLALPEPSAASGSAATGLGGRVVVLGVDPAGVPTISRGRDPVLPVLRVVALGSRRPERAARIEKGFLMGGFKSFVLRGNLVDLAVAVIIGHVVRSRGHHVHQLAHRAAARRRQNYFTNEENSFGAFMNAVIAFVILAAIVYFLVVLPYTKAKEKYFPSPAPGTPEDTVLLREIRDALVTGRGTPTV